MIARALDWFTLRASRGATPAGRADSDALRAALDRARDALERARAQWIDGEGPPALSALEEAERAWSEALALQPALRTIARYDAPADGERRTISTYDRRWWALSAALDRTAHVARSNARNGATLAGRWALLLALLALGADRVAAARRKAQFRATASASWGINTPPEHIADGKPETAWVLPDGALGWIQSAFPLRTVREVALFNVRGLPLYGARVCTVELLRGTAVVRSEVIDMSSTVGTFAPHVLRLPSPVEADAVRVTIRTFHSLGGGLSEIEVR